MKWLKAVLFFHVWRGFLILSLLSGRVSFAGTRFAFKPALKQILHGSLSWNHRAPSPSCHHVLGGILMAMKEGVCGCVCVREHCFYREGQRKTEALEGRGRLINISST